MLSGGGAACAVRSSFPDPPCQTLSAPKKSDPIVAVVAEQQGVILFGWRPVHRWAAGRYPIHTGGQSGVLTVSQRTWVQSDEVFLPERLTEAGYVCHAVGKWCVSMLKAPCVFFFKKRVF